MLAGSIAGGEKAAPIDQSRFNVVECGIPILLITLSSPQVMTSSPSQLASSSSSR